MKLLFLLIVSVTCVVCSPIQERIYQLHILLFFCKIALARIILLVTAPLTLEDSPSRIPGEYVVVLKEGIEDEKCKL